MASKGRILVTGCSSGIGAHCVRRLRDDGWTVIATARKDADIAALRDAGFETHFLDYRDAGSIDACFNAVAGQGKRLDVLFNNGAYAQPGAVEDVPDDALREQFEANVFGWHRLTRHAVKHMRAHGGGRIVHNSSVLGFVPVPWRGAYTASKHALEGLMLTLRQELDGSGIHVSLIEPGPIPSKIALNGIAYAERHIDLENSVHAKAYAKRLAEMRAGGTPDISGMGAEPVYVALRRALTAASPRPHYHVTANTRAAALMKRFLPASIVYRLLARGT